MAIRVGFVGAGFIAHRHAAILAGMDDVTIAGIADVDLARASELAAAHGARAYPDADAMVAAAALDVLWVCVPPFAHGPPERLAVAAGLALFVEKPLAVDLDTAEAIATAVERAGLVTGVGYHWRYLDIFQQAQALVAANPVRLANGFWLDATPAPRWWSQRDRSGGQTIEQTTHILDALRVLVGEPCEVYAVGSRTADDGDGDGDGDVWDVTAATLRFPGGAVATVASTAVLDWRHRVGLHLFSRSLAIELSEFELVVDVGQGRPVMVAEGDAVARQDRAFLDAVQGQGGSVLVDYGEALRSHRLACAVTRSAADHAPLALA